MSSILTLSSKKDFDSITGVTEFNPIFQFKVPVPLNEGTLNIQTKTLNPTILLQGVLPFSLIVYTSLEFATPVGVLQTNYNIPIVGQTFYPLTITTNIYRNSINNNNLIFSTTQSHNNPINPVVEKIPTPTPTTIAGLNDYLTKISQLNLINITIPLHWVDTLPSPLTFSGNCNNVTNTTSKNLTYYVTVQADYTSNIAPPNNVVNDVNLNAGLSPTLGDIFDLINNVQTATSTSLGAFYQPEYEITGLSNYSISATEL